MQNNIAMPLIVANTETETQTQQTTINHRTALNYLNSDRNCPSPELRLANSALI